MTGVYLSWCCVSHFFQGYCYYIFFILSRRPDYDPQADASAFTATETNDDDCAACVTLSANETAVAAVKPFCHDIKDAYSRDKFYSPIVRYWRTPWMKHCYCSRCPLAHTCCAVL